MCVPIHRQRDGQVPGQLLGELRVNTPGHKIRDERVPERMEVSEAGFGVVRDAGDSQVNPEHLRGLLWPRSGKQPLPFRVCRIGELQDDSLIVPTLLAFCEPLTQPRGQVGVNRQNIFAAVFAVRGLQRNRRRIVFQVERKPA